MAKTQIVYGLIADGGDGSSSLRWFLDYKTVERLLEDEQYYANEGSPAATLTFPADFDLAAAGIRLQD